MTFDTPILFLIFNRPDTTAQVFERISALRPKYLYIAADGPRKNKKTDVENCRQTRNIVQNIDWHCEVKILFQEKNLGCGKAPATAITWFFDHVEEGIILEDDCLPDPSFFTFCQTLLGYYRTDARVALLSGNAHYPGSLPPESYYFLKYPATWGWATWRRTWQQYDYELNNLPTNSILFSEFWNVTFDKIYHKKMTTCWDYQLYYLDRKSVV